MGRMVAGRWLGECAQRCSHQSEETGEKKCQDLVNGANSLESGLAQSFAGSVVLGT